MDAIVPNKLVRHKILGLVGVVLSDVVITHAGTPQIDVRLVDGDETLVLSWNADNVEPVTGVGIPFDPPMNEPSALEPALV